MSDFCSISSIYTRKFSLYVKQPKSFYEEKFIDNLEIMTHVIEGGIESDKGT
ncbi:hypothetical protein TBCH5v1_1025 [Thermococcus barophilus]|uniref:Uncharacterized protein n=1 Tax=Thermococcus barophilus TaxID=55802 RepID=A0A0S1XB38_THEBA|nr:hypothetical protein TBCH5v1_1025 [Thermococcus barophilus]